MTTAETPRETSGSQANESPKYILIFKSASPRAFPTRNFFSAPPTNKMPLYVAPSDRLARFDLVDEPVTLNYTAGSVGAV